jgi:hypothetical protein
MNLWIRLCTGRAQETGSKGRALCHTKSGASRWNLSQNILMTDINRLYSNNNLTS